MYGIFMESVVIFKLYGGTGFLTLLFLFSLLYLFFTEKDKRIRAVLIYTPLTLLFLFFFPIFRKVFVRLMEDGTTYYRVLWLIPLGIVIVYAAIKLTGSVFERWGRVAAAVCLGAGIVLIALGGKYVYASQHMSKAENLYHLPQEVVEICDLIAPEEGRIWAVFPTDLVYFVRQYDSNIQMPYGRDMVEPVWDYYNEVHEVMNHPETIDVEKLLEASRKKPCTYIVFPKNKTISGNPQELGLKLLDTIDGYPVYHDEIAQKQLEEMIQQ